ncbi:protein cholesin [Ascaphus truei]|uniref:protein cholesin n=1 Tax=Ascaphus truei TaxID=8439 RepID=UPI003F591CA5
MAKNKTLAADKNERKKKLAESKSEDMPPKKKKLTPEVEAAESLEFEDLTAEEQRVLERKLKKERKKEEKQLKRESEVEGQEEEPAKPSACELALKYLKRWSKKHKEWKFQKTRQTWLLLHMYDQEKVPDKYFNILLDYLGGLKGSARDITVQKAEASMREYDVSETEEASALQKMSRMRDVLQLLS